MAYTYILQQGGHKVLNHDRILTNFSKYAILLVENFDGGGIMPDNKFYRVDTYLRVAVGMEFKELSGKCVGASIPGVVEIRPYPKRNSRKAYLDLGGVETHSSKIGVHVPKTLSRAMWGEILFSNTKTGVLVTFGRKTEEMPFALAEGKYISLRLWREEENKFEPVYVRVDKGSTTYFLKINARWVGKTITIGVERDPGEELPNFLT